jgi:hypothetical protein
MASKHTTNYGLNQWEATDPVLRVDFNADNAALEQALTAKGNCQIQFGSYTGTGTYGSKTPNTLTFEKQPVLLYVSNEDGGDYFMAYGGNARTSYRDASGYTSILNISWQKNQVSWYSTEAVHRQMNTSGQTFYYVALFSAT